MCSDVYTDNHIMFTCQEKSDCSEKKVEGSISEIGASLERRARQLWTSNGAPKEEPCSTLFVLVYIRFLLNRKLMQISC